MKQRITAKQLQELTEEQKQKLREWWKPQCYDIYYDTIFDDFGIALTDEQGNISGCVAERKESLLPLLSIGQMLEFLESYNKILTLSNFKEFKFKEWCITTGLGKEPWQISSSELCDTLWETVKRLL